MGVLQSRREILGRALLLGVGSAAFPPALRAEPDSRWSSLATQLSALERASGGRLGVAVLDTASGEVVGHRIAERFAMCSTFKLLLTAVTLQCADRGREQMQRAVAIPAQPLIGNSPLTGEHAGGTMSVAALCHAAMTRSDNTAANLLLEALGGPAGFTVAVCAMGDGVTRLDRIETALNEAMPGDLRDTTTPAAMAEDVRRFMFGDLLSAASRTQWTQWMVENGTGATSLRGGFPVGWRSGDKTGSNLENTKNDVAILWPSAHPPMVVAAYLTQCTGTEEKRAGVLLAVGRIVAGCLR